MPSSEQMNHVDTLLGIEPDHAEAPFLVEGYDKSCLISSYISNDAPDVMAALKADTAVLPALGLALARMTALDYYQNSLDRVAENTQYMEDEMVQAHLSYITNCISSVDAMGNVKFDNPEAEEAFKNMKKQLHEVYADIVFKQTVLATKYNIEGFPPLHKR
eukprot:CAMPEP_0185033110 /NCGR_PEP_ID=MMETSP1103-20130426/21769_1 /TAXON_ID=36769 /ORGANISM="Paraphysomonas bandaiensis, Strain Caron Lab Isolate" /LENGTH=160 /DNA_ID=CAMNT_0027569257 /DNA_START=282 /DNA_END=764 /DNA_ORIENTATION=-